MLSRARSALAHLREGVRRLATTRRAPTGADPAGDPERDDVTSDLFDDVPDGAGCTEIWEYRSTRARHDEPPGGGGG